MFTQKCFIRKNTKEITSIIENIGYKLLFSAKNNYGPNLLCKDNRCRGYMDEQDSYGFVDCGCNDNLFFAVASLRDDTDKNQLFFHNEDTDCRYPIECIHNEFHMCTVDPDTCEFIDHKDNYHKGTPQEILKHFKTE